MTEQEDSLEMSVKQHDQNRRQHKRKARAVLLEIAQDKQVDDKVRVAAASALLGAPGWVATTLGWAKKVKDLG